jgi:mono/diheme cytochrome c family protein
VNLKTPVLLARRSVAKCWSAQSALSRDAATTVAALAAGVLLGLARASAAEAPTLPQLPAPAARTVRFAEDIRPIFEANCYKCHGPEKQKSGFRLDDKAAALRGGDGGVAIVPGKSADSRLVQFVAGLVEDMQMPPRKSGGRALRSDEIALIRAWIDQGANWPESGGRGLMAARMDYWTFRSPKRPPFPQPRHPEWARNEIDLFILARLEQEGLRPSPEADRRTLIRRLSFDLTGLPPAPDDVQGFVEDDSPDAYVKQVDRLLESPRYGERWARHWLDTVHFGETHGYDKDKTRPHAWPYRDYVIRAFNSDTPYGRFVQEQIAGDVLYPDDSNGVVALGFLAAGPWDFVGHAELPESKTDGLIARYNDRDDMVMTTMSTFQSLTVHCARCHDHKFDPIAQEDYYSLQAVFAGVDRADRCFDSDPVLFQKRRQLLARKQLLEGEQAALQARVEQVSPAILKLVETRRAELKKEIASLPATGNEESPSNGFHSEIAAQPDLRKWVQVDLGQSSVLDEVRLIPARPTDFPDTPGFGFPVRFKVELDDRDSFESATVLLDSTTSDYPNPGDQPVIVPAKATHGRYVRVTANRLWQRTGDYVFALAELQAISDGKNVALNKTVAASDSIESGRWARKYLVDGYSSRGVLDKQLASVAATNASRRTELENSLRYLESERRQLLPKLLDADTWCEVERIESALTNVSAKIAELPTPSFVYAAAHEFTPIGSFKPAVHPRVVNVLRRGEVKQPIHPAVPGALGCISGLAATFELTNPEDEGSRRAALALWLTQPTNLQTRRSLVNRVWLYHFGRGLVETPNDFGHMGALPTHPELLDWLAFWFLDHGESLKALHRLIVTSAAYRQVSDSNPEGARRDADNRYLWRMNRSRLDAESLHDTLLLTAGRLDLTMGGPSDQQFFFKDDHSPVYDYARFDPETTAGRRRSIYRFIVRSVPDPLMDALDCPDSSLLAPKRNVTITALQALALLNDPFVLRQAEHTAARLRQASPDSQGQIETLYKLALSRAPSQLEAARLVEYSRQHGLTNLCRLVFNTSEFMFVD